LARARRARGLKQNHPEAVSSLTFVSRAAVDAKIAERYLLERPLVAVRDCRKSGKKIYRSTTPCRGSRSTRTPTGGGGRRVADL
jgi:urease alpha subunit